MPWQKKRKNYGKNRYYSVSKKFRREGKTTEEFENIMSELLLEDIIALKLELAANAAGGTIYGLPIYNAIVSISREAICKYAISACRSYYETARFLGIDKATMTKFSYKYDLESFFKDDENI